MADLPVASLGYQSPINTGAYIPAPAYRPKLSRQLLEAFLTGAGGAAGSKLTEAAFTPDMSKQANADPQLVAQGLAPGPRNAFQRFFTPMSQDELDKAKEIAQTGQYQQLMGGLEKQRVGIEGQQAQTAKAGEESEAGARLTSAELEQAKQAEAVKEFGQEYGLRAPEAAAQTKLAGAQAGQLGAETSQSQLLTGRMRDQTDQQGLDQLQKAHPEIDHITAHQVIQQIGTPSSYYAKGKGMADYENDFMTAAQQAAKAQLGTPATAPTPQGLGLSALLNRPNFLNAMGQASTTPMMGM
jgi:hypothetical protein